MSGRRWLHADREGSIIAWSDAGGNLGAAFGYSPYGEPSSWTGSRFAYTGQVAIPEAELYHYKSRVYDPGLGRFLQTDKIGYASDLNLYAYVHDDPVNGIDPSGMQCGITIDIPSRPDLGGPSSSPDCDDAEVGLGGASADSPMPSFHLAAFIRPSGGSPQSKTPTITCASRLPNGKTVGDMDQELNQRIAQSEDEGNGLSGALTFFQGVNTGGILDFKNTMRGQGYSGSYLAAAGNFAYGAAGADYFGTNPVGAQITYFGGTVYAASHFKAGIIPPGTIFPQDASGAKNIGAGFKSGGC